MRLIKSSLLVVLLSTCTLVFAQSNSSNQKTYRNGKELFQQGKYELAMQMFSPLTKTTDNNPYQEYASFYYALSAYHTDQRSVAKNMLLQIDQKNSSWKDIGEARLWLARIYFEENDFDKAFSTLNQIKGGDLKENITQMKLHYLKEAEDIEVLKNLNQKNPKDKEVAVALADKIHEQQIVDQDVKLLNKLISQFNLDPKKYAPEEIGPSVKKEFYNVAVLLPFLTEEISNGRNVGNQFVLDVYEGIRLANEKLKEEGVSINLFAYDTRKDSSTTAKLLNLDEMKAMDLIVGPLYPIPSRLTSQFSLRNKINMLNPISYNSQVVGSNPYSFLFKPSYQTQARKAAEFSSKSFENKKAIIVFGTSLRDSVMAYTYRAEAEKNNFEIEMMVKIAASEPKKALDLISGSEDEGFTIPENSIGHMFVTSTDETVVANILSALNSRSDQIAVIGSEEWLDYKFVSYDQIERFSIYFIAPNFIDFSKSSVERFRNNYIEETRTLPSQSAYSGYDAFLFAGRMLHNHGNYFQNKVYDAGLVETELYQGINYSQSNDNQFVPIIKMVKSEFVMVNDQ